MTFYTKDTRNETFLTQMDVEFQFITRIAFSELVPKWREINLARPIPVREEVVLAYATLMEDGSAAPAPILYKTPLGYIILDGVQRIAAGELAGAETIAAYVVISASDDRLAAINLLANSRLQGSAEPPEWTRRRAVEVLVVMRNISVEEVARMGGWGVGDINTIKKSLEWNTTVQGLGGPDLPDTMIAVLSKYTSRSELGVAGQPAVEFLRTLKSAKFAAVDAEPYVEDFFRPVSKSSRRFSVLSERLVEFKKEPEVQIRLQGRKGLGLSRDVLLRRAMKTVITVIGEVKQSGDTLLYMDEYFKMSGQIERGLHVLSPSHQKPAKPVVPTEKWG